MLFLKYVLMAGGITMIMVAAGILIYDLSRELRYRRAMGADGAVPSGSSTRDIASVMKFQPFGSMATFFTSV